MRLRKSAVATGVMRAAAAIWSLSDSERTALAYAAYDGEDRPADLAALRPNVLAVHKALMRQSPCERHASEQLADALIAALPR
jgi:hypothetical protein